MNRAKKHAQEIAEKEEVIAAERHQAHRSAFRPCVALPPPDFVRSRRSPFLEKPGNLGRQGFRANRQSGQRARR